MPRQPTVMIPYPGASPKPDVQDIAVYLRPEANGVRVESVMLKVIRSNSDFRDHYRMIYLANIPGDFLRDGHIVEEHYSTKIHFSREGGRAFTKTMIDVFEDHYGLPFDPTKVIGANEAMELLRMSEDELFHIWVAPEEHLIVHGQSVKPYNGYYVVNYDIPALLKKYDEHTDIFSMILRTNRPYKDVHRLFQTMGTCFQEEGILTNPVLYSHVLHYSHGPFEQVLDEIGYVYTPDSGHIKLEDMSFFRYLVDRGCCREDILEAVKQPIMPFKTDEDAIIEKNLFNYTYENSYEEACRKFLNRMEKENSPN
jgi:hypothetical protein